MTGVILLAESHLAVHTWPEHGTVTIDIYVCHLLQDNQRKAQHVLDQLIEGFAPKRAHVQLIERRIPADANILSRGSRSMGEGLFEHRIGGQIGMRKQQPTLMVL